MTQVRFYATLEPPYARLETVPNSVDCGYVPPGGGGGEEPDPDPDPEPEVIWAGLWAPGGIPVTVSPQAEEAPAFVEADLYAGFPEGHPLAANRPLTFVSAVRATVAPSGVATLNLAPYLRSEVGALLSSGSRRLDLNSLTAQTEDVYVGYQLTMGGQIIAQGYALNSVLSTEQLVAYVAGRKLSPFGNVLPLWPGYEYQVSRLRADFTVEAVKGGPGLSGGGAYIYMPCPRYGLPVAWLSPEGGFGYWVFSGQPVHGDEVGEGQGTMKPKPRSCATAAGQPRR
ncbi:hypothetical protein DNI29_16865 [Hymenobacter sediminis]|uniref:hypothetical protein n=1 Tax=Hymenobacter sediminis TaxID=2218621 RepID=UPI000DA653E7|nr:hypothetical protein [Hymenobacter sediminis]RPD45821.1 hypothetical protein DNI29_16865 [Hymenobacter sediminis]